jgi:hypothetical protein
MAFVHVTNVAGNKKDGTDLHTTHFGTWDCTFIFRSGTGFGELGHPRGETARFSLLDHEEVERGELLVAFADETPRSYSFLSLTGRLFVKNFSGSGDQPRI